MPQLFYAHNTDGELILVAAKIVDDIILTGKPRQTEQFLNAFNDRFKLGSIASGPGHLRFYGLNIIQHSDFSSTVGADDKLNALEAFPLTRGRRRMPDDELTHVERSSYSSINSSIG